MAIGFGRLRLSPDAFWQLTPREFAAAVRGLTGQLAPLQPPSRDDFHGLAARYPDHT